MFFFRILSEGKLVDHTVKPGLHCYRRRLMSFAHVMLFAEKKQKKR